MVPGFDLAFHGGEPLLLFRLFLATLVGAMIGWNRFRAGKPAGVGTHALVALGAAFFVAIPVLTNSLDALFASDSRHYRGNRLPGRRRDLPRPRGKACTRPDLGRRALGDSGARHHHSLRLGGPCRCGDPDCSARHHRATLRTPLPTECRQFPVLT